MKKNSKLSLLTFLMLSVLFTFSLTQASASSNAWTIKADIPYGVDDTTSTALNGKIYIFAGDGSNKKVQVYDPNSNTWSAKRDMSRAMNWVRAVAVNDKIYTFGGADGSVNGPYQTKMYDPVTDTWTARTDSPIQIWGAGTSAAVGSKVYSLDKYGTLLYEYDTINDTWTQKSDNPIPRQNISLASANGKLYAIGGKNSGGYLKTTQEYDPSTDTWTTKANMPTPRSNFGITSLNGLIYAIGGTPSTTAVEEYDPFTNTWSSKASMSTPRTELTAVSVNGKIYAIGGISGSSQLLKKNEEYTPSLTDAPTNLTASGNNNPVNLTWNYTRGAGSYNVKRSTTLGGPYTTIATNILTLNYSDTTVIPGSTYYYVVSAVNASGESANSNEANITLTPSAPTNLQAESGNAIVGLSWTGSAGATSYNVKRATVDGGPYEVIADSVTATTYTYNDTSVINGTTYYYVVTAINAGGESDVSNQAVGLPRIPIPATPTIASISAADSQVNLAWNAVDLAESYNVKRSTSLEGPYTTIASSTTNNFIDTSVINGQLYFYRVSAVNAGGESGDSNIVAVMYSSN